MRPDSRALQRKSGVAAFAIAGYSPNDKFVVNDKPFEYFERGGYSLNFMSRASSPTRTDCCKTASTPQSVA
jgi:hypothetical protein